MARWQQRDSSVDAHALMNLLLTIGKRKGRGGGWGKRRGERGKTKRKRRILENIRILLKGEKSLSRRMGKQLPALEYSDVRYLNFRSPLSHQYSAAYLLVGGKVQRHFSK